MKRFQIGLVLGLLAAGLLPGVAIADQGRIFKDASGSVFVYGLSPNSTFRAGFDSPPKRKVQSNSCGLLVIKPSNQYPAGTVQVEGTAIAPATLQTQTLPKCQNGTLEVARSSNFKLSDGSVVVVGKAANRQYEVTYPGRLASRNVRANACGFARLRSSERSPLGSQIQLPTILGGAAVFAVASLSTSEQLVCNKSKLYLPSGWASPLATSIVVDSSVSGGSTGGSGASTGSTTGGSTGSAQGSTSTGSQTTTGNSTGSSTSSGTASGIHGPIVGHPGWIGLTFSYGWYNEENPPIQAAKKPNGDIVIANYPTPGSNDSGSYSYAVGPREDGDWVVTPTRNSCGYVVLNNPSGGLVVYKLRNGEFDPVADFAKSDLPQLEGGILDDLAAGCS